MVMNIRQILDDDKIMAHVLETALNEIKDNGLQYSPDLAIKTFKQEERPERLRTVSPDRQSSKTQDLPTSSSYQ